MRKRFRMPHRPLGEAWFLGEERKTYPGLLNEDPDAWPEQEIDDALHALVSGPTCFGPSEEWTAWLRFLLPRIISLIDDWRSADRYEQFVTAVMAQYPDSTVDPPYPDFYDDLINTLGRTLMGETFWKHGHIQPGKALDGCLTKTIYGRIASGGGAFSAQIYLALKYLDTAAIGPWVQSLVDIETSIWRAKLVIWLAASKDMLLTESFRPGGLPQACFLDASWDDNHYLDRVCGFPSMGNSTEMLPPFLDAPRRQAFVAALRVCLSQSRLEAWGISLLAAEQQLGKIDDLLQQFDAARELVLSEYGLPP